MFWMLSNQHYPHRANQKLCSWANAVFQNHGVCGQVVPSFPSPSPIIHFLLLLSQLSRRTSRGDACYAGYRTHHNYYFVTKSLSATLFEVSKREQPFLASGKLYYVHWHVLLFLLHCYFAVNDTIKDMLVLSKYSWNIWWIKEFYLMTT